VDPVELFRLLHDRYARTILLETSTRPMSAEELSDACDASLPTVYRRVNDLCEQNLLAERTEPDPDGHHYAVFQSRVDSIEVEFDADGVDVAVSTDDEDVDRAGAEDAVDRFTRLWGDMGGGDDA
jgi:predicted ArsR family transcriptional regulator